MGIFSGLFRSRDKPADSTAGSRYAFYMGGSSAGKLVTERSDAVKVSETLCLAKVSTDRLTKGVGWSKNERTFFTERQGQV